MTLALPPRPGRERRAQVRGHLCGARQLSEGRAEPLRVGRVGALHKEAEAHQVADEARADEGRAYLVADESGAPHQVLLLPDARPGGGEQVEPHVFRIICEPLSYLFERYLVMEDSARA